MTDEEIEKEAKEYSQGNFYSEQGFLYGYERGFAEGRKEKCNSCGLRQQKRINLAKENEQLKEKLDVFEDMVADMCTTDNPVLFDYLCRILKKYRKIV